jgi:hypothetical protein
MRGAYVDAVTRGVLEFSEIPVLIVPVPARRRLRPPHPAPSSLTVT